MSHTQHNGSALGVSEHTDPRHIEQHNDRKRAEISQTLDELEGRLSPQQVVDQGMDLMREHAGDLANTLGRSFKQNPAPFIVTGAALAWLAASTSRNRTYDDDYHRYPNHRRPHSRGPSARQRSALNNLRHGYSDDELDTGAVSTNRPNSPDGYGSDMDQSARNLNYSQASSSPSPVGSYEGQHRFSYSQEDNDDSGASILDQLTSAVEELSGKASDMSEESEAKYKQLRADATQHAILMRERARLAASELQQTSEEWRGQAEYAAKDTADYLKNNPIVTAILGISAGALIGALLPKTETETRHLGGQAKDTIDRAKATALETMAQTREKIEEGAADAKADIKHSLDNLSNSEDGDSAGDEFTHKPSYNKGEPV